MPIPDVSVAAANRLKDMVDTYGADVSVYQFTSTPTASIYRQRSKTYSPATVCRGHVAFNPSQDMITAIGAGDDVSGMITFGRIHLETAFAPETVMQEMISLKDEVEIFGVRYRIVKIQYTGYLNNKPEVMVVVFDDKPGDKGVA